MMKRPTIKARVGLRLNENKPKPRKNYAVIRLRYSANVEVYCHGEWVRLSGKVEGIALLLLAWYPVTAWVSHEDGYEVEIAIAVPVRRARRLGLLDCAVDITVGANLPTQYPIIVIFAKD